MKKFLAVFSALLALGTCNVSAQAATPYISASGGVAMYTDVNNKPVKAGFNAKGAFGVTMDSNRVEAELGSQFNIDWIVSALFGDVAVVSASTFFVNGYHDFKGWVLEPYLTAGVGYAYVEYGQRSAWSLSENYDGSRSAFAYQVGAGAALPLSDNLAIDAQYRYFGTSTINDEKFGNFSASSHNILTGIRISF